MSGAVGSPFTASMFRFDGVRILVVFIYVNTFSILLWCGLSIALSIKGIYFTQTKNSRTEQCGIVSEVRSGCDFGWCSYEERGDRRFTGTKNPARWPGLLLLRVNFVEDIVV